MKSKSLHFLYSIEIRFSWEKEGFSSKRFYSEGEKNANMKISIRGFWLEKFYNEKKNEAHLNWS